MDPTEVGINAGLDPSLAAYMPRYIQIESGGNPNARTGSYTGLLQMGPDEIRRYGGNDLTAGARMYAGRANWFQNQYGRQPSPTELYLISQQGEGGIAAHMANPNAPAWQNMYSTAEGQQKGQGWARRAIWGNVPDDVKAQYPGGVDNLTSQQFMDLWQHKVERTPLTPSPSYASASPPVLPGAASAPTSAAEPAPQPAAASGFGNPLSGGGNPLFSLSNQLLSQDQPAPPPPMQMMPPQTAAGLRRVLMKMGQQQQSLPDPVSQRLIDVINSVS